MQAESVFSLEDRPPMFPFCRFFTFQICIAHALLPFPSAPVMTIPSSSPQSSWQALVPYFAYRTTFRLPLPSPVHQITPGITCSPLVQPEYSSWPIHFPRPTCPLHTLLHIFRLTFTLPLTASRGNVAAAFLPLARNFSLSPPPVPAALTHLSHYLALAFGPQLHSPLFSKF